ncbi:SHD1 domain-containing protein [Rubripirellula reticaptiva]|uniref:SLA1 homology domain-containing protein n=1 Tax=Rubripirellula reticaptiva TaxID=2528013 RepID=A0A5C6F879_9BACT|nr:SHD1 domain-containing protein [Rubripirellula reticaptiva]TWU56316.1 hypothetical protein Poly59_26200 [Rubripirellula reticaptiva]
MRATHLVFSLLILLVMSPSSYARKWSSSSGAFTLEAEAIAFNETTVILKKEKGDLVAVEVAELTDVDRDYLKSKELVDKLAKSVEGMQTWTSVDGLMVRGRVLAFGRKNLEISRQRGKVHVGDLAFSDLDPLHQKLILKIMSKLESKTFESERELASWSVGLQGQPKVYPLEGVLMELESGDKIAVPFFLFSEQDLKVLQPGWQAWLESDKDKTTQDRESLMMQAEAMEYQRNEMQHRKIELLKLNMMAVATGVTSVWEIGLQPGQGVYGRPTTVVVSARDSRVASQMATSRYPGYTVTFVRRASR